MSIDKVQKAAKDFLADKESGVLSIKGSWGVGKTYFWSNLISQDSNAADFSFDRYAYVSLFGITSLDELKFSIFEHIVKESLIGKPISVDNLKDNWDDLGERLGRKSVRFLQYLPWFNKAGSAIQSASFLSVRDALICFDDFERKGDSLSAKDVLGLISLLKEQRNCKIVLIFNDANMDDKSSNEYSQFREKVIDVEIRYSPTPEEAANLVFTQNTDLDKKLIELSTKLEIKNIRILSKIKKLVNLAEPLLEGYEEEVLHQVAHTVTIAALCYYSHDENIPTYDYLKNNRQSYFGLDRNAEKPAHEKNWDSLLTRYDFRYTDDFDNLLFSVIESGYIEESSFIECANQQNEQIKANKSQNSFSGAWELYHNSFLDNEAELVKALTDALNTNGRHVSPMNLNGTVRLLKKLGKTVEASQLITTYIDLNKDKSNLFDLDSYAFAGDMDDPEIIARFNEIFNESREIKSLDDVLESMAGKDGWGSSDEEVLAATTTEQFYEFFKKQNTKDLPKYIDICLRFGRFQNASEQYKTIASNAENALKMIANESLLNKIRVQRFGINIDQES